MSVQIDTFRVEKRFLVLAEDFKAFVDDISRVLKQQVFSGNGITRTVYFNNDDCPVPWGTSLKARKFLPCFSPDISISPQDVYRIEIKGRKENDLRVKVERDLPISEAPKFICEHAEGLIPGTVLRPYAANEYARIHFVSPEDNKMLRVTIDRDIKYAHFEEGSLVADWTGEDDFVRVELKVAPEYMESPEYKRILEIVLKYHPLPVISKRARAFHFASLKLNNRGSKIKKEFRDLEIESKFIVRHSNPAALLVSLKRYLQHHSVYDVPSRYPYSKEEGGINYYWSCKDAQDGAIEGLKIRLLGSFIKSVFKKSTLMVPDRFGMNCILERQEVKGAPIAFTSKSYNEMLAYGEQERGPLGFVGYLFRSRKAFWPENRLTGRVYHISMDECVSSDGKTIFQLEIEHTGRLPERFGEGDEVETKKTVYEDLAELSHETLSFCNREGECLIPTTLTKFDWLRSR